MGTLNQDPVYERTFFTSATLSHGTVQTLLQIAIPIAVQKLERLRGIRVNKRRIRQASFCPLKTLSRPAGKRAPQSLIWEKSYGVTIQMKRQKPLWQNLCQVPQFLRIYQTLLQFWPIQGVGSISFNVSMKVDNLDSTQR